MGALEGRFFTVFGEDEGTSVLEEHVYLKVRNEKTEDANKKMKECWTVLKKKWNGAVLFSATWDTVTQQFPQLVTSSIFSIFNFYSQRNDSYIINF